MADESRRLRSHFYRAACALALALLIPLSCVPRQSGGIDDSDVSVVHYERTREHVARGELDDGLHALRAALESGFGTPMKVVNDPHLSALIADSRIRPELRALLHAYARETVVSMVPDGEPGEPLVVQGTVVNERDREPISGAIIELVHADAGGQYSDDTATFNPRLFAYLRSGGDGTFRVQTIRPGSYKDDKGAGVPSHIHFAIAADGYRPYAAEFQFDDDPLMTDEAHRLASREGIPIASVRKKGGVRFSTVTIPLQPASPR